MVTAKTVEPSMAPVIVPEEIDYEALDQYKAAEMYPHFVRLMAEANALRDELEQTEASADKLSVAIATIWRAKNVKEHTIGGVKYHLRKVNGSELDKLYEVTPRKPKSTAGKPVPSDPNAI